MNFANMIIALNTDSWWWEVWGGMTRFWEGDLGITVDGKKKHVKVLYLLLR